MHVARVIENKVHEAYDLLEKNKTQEACTIFLDVWEDLKKLMQQKSLQKLDELQTAYPWTDFVANWVQDIESELWNAGIKNPIYFSKRIQYCEELIERAADTDDLMIENTRRAIAESHHALGNSVECDRLFRDWLNKDPAWGWGYIGWSDCYHFGANKTAKDLVKAEQIISQGLAAKDLRDRADVIERAIELYQSLGDTQRENELKSELDQLTAIKKVPYKLNKQFLEKTLSSHVGRNDPCPCGSGKKYKKCCGK